MSLMTKKSNYAIQSVPHTMMHAKIASRDYFGSEIKEDQNGEQEGDILDGVGDGIEEEIQMEDHRNREPHGFVAKNNFGNTNFYAKYKNTLP